MSTEKKTTRAQHNFLEKGVEDDEIEKIQEIELIVVSKLSEALTCQQIDKDGTAEQNQRLLMRITHFFKRIYSPHGDSPWVMEVLFMKS